MMQERVVQASASASKSSAIVTIKVLNVGQGNCVTLKVEEEGEVPQYMLIDAGSSGFGKAIKFSQQIGELPPLRTPVKSSGYSSFRSPPPSTIKKHPIPSTPRQLEQKKIKQGAKQAIRAALGEGVEEDEFDSFLVGNEPNSIKVKTIVITHPDKDHYIWLKELFTDNDRVENIVLAGLPEDYNKSTLDWLKANIGAVNIFFPALSYLPMKESTFEEIIRGDNKARDYAEHACSDEDGIIKMDTGEPVSKEFQNAFYFGENIKVFMLSINPLHVKGRTGRIIRLCDEDPEDKNKESLVMKIQNGSSSMILTGDATQATTNKIFGNYHQSFLKSEILLASHHGSSTHGSNSQEWLDLINPRYVLISNGLSYGHPSEEAYERFHMDINPLKNVTRHSVIVGKASKEAKEGTPCKEANLHETNAPIFSTLSSGTITVTLSGKAQIETQNEGIIKENNGLPEEETSKIISFDESADDLINIGEDEEAQNFALNLSVTSKDFLTHLHTYENKNYLTIARAVSPGTYEYTPSKLKNIKEGTRNLNPLNEAKLLNLLKEKFPEEYERFLRQ